MTNKGFFGRFGGAYIPEVLQKEMDKLEVAYNLLKNNKEFKEQVNYIRKHYQGRPTPITHAINLSKKIGGAQIYLKREDLNHTGAHKINHCIGEVLLAKHLGKTRVIAETGAGQHGVALATAATYLGLECEIHMGEADIAKKHSNVLKMQLLGCKLVSVSEGQKSLKEAVDSAFAAYLKNPRDSLYCMGSVVGPHPFPTIVRDYQSVIGDEAKSQMIELTEKLPDHVVACVGGGSNAIGIFSAFLDNSNVKLYGVEALGKGQKIGEHSAAIAYGTEGIIHGFKTIMLKDKNGNPAPVSTIASGLDYPAIGPEHAYLHSNGRVKYVCIDNKECQEAFYMLPKTDDIIAALESSHAVAYAMKLAKEIDKAETILVNLSGRGDKDIDFITGLENPK